MQRSLQHAEHERCRMQRLCRHQQLSLLALKLLLRSQQHDQGQGLERREVGDDEGKIQGDGGTIRENKHHRH